MPISQAGSLNTTALVVPNLYVQIVPPSVLALNGVPTNLIGVIGTASWGAVGVATPCNSATAYAQNFGPIQPRKYDLGTPVATAIIQGASNFMCVRATDGTDLAASASITGTGTAITFTALYTGSLGNTIKVTLATGSKSGTTKAVISIGYGLSTMPAIAPEVYDNISGTGNAFWVNLANAINTGAGQARGPSLLVLATAGAGTGTVGLGTTTLSGGTDGASPSLIATTTTLLTGSDTIPRTGMYALRGRGCSVGMVSDMDTFAAWTTIDAYGLSEGTYMIQTTPASDTISNAVANKGSAGLDDYASKLMFGDWIWWADPVNGVTRLVSPQGFVCGKMATLSPEQSTLNKQIYGIAGSQKSGIIGSGQSQTYADGDYQLLFQAGIDVISNPQPGGSYWGCRLGHNSSSNAAINGDNYTRMTNYIAATAQAGMGKYVGQVINSSLFQNITATLSSFFGNMLSQGQLGSLDGSLPYSVICNASNNPLARTSLGYVQADVQVQYQGINEKFLVNIQGGTTVIVGKSTTPITV